MIAAIQLVKTHKPSPLKYATKEERPSIEKFLMCIDQDKDPLAVMTEDELEVLVRFEDRMMKEGRNLLPAPIPLTPKLDKKLTEDGVLPPDAEQE